MNWSSSPTVRDRIFAALPYILPITAGIPYGVQLINQFPLFGFLLLPLSPLIRVYMGLEQTIPFFGLLVFLALILLVVRNERISRFIRFNTMQAILLSFILAVFSLILSILNPSLLFGELIASTLANMLFLGMVVSVGYSLVQTLRGEYAEIPTISDAVHMQVP
ncbi:MAG: Tic20 family protein [Cyanobacteriota bacterium]|jgi:uncharacterized membrane protein|nr:Tic20 family protein [Cyanobacteriota bacterium]